MIVADDPLAAVDLAVGQQLFSALQAYADGGKAVILAMNQLDLAKRCTHIVHFEAGKLVTQGPAAAVAAAVPSFFKKDAGIGHQVVVGGAGHVDGGGAPRDAAITGCGTDTMADKDATETSEVVPEGARELVTHDPEKRLMGSVKSSISSKYLKSFGWPLFIVCLLTGHISYAFMGFNDRWLAAWVEEQDANPDTIDTSV